MSGTAIVTEIISILVSGISGIAQGIGEGLSTLATSIFLQTTGSGEEASTTLSVFGILVVCFAGISLAIGLCRLIVRWISTLGGSRV